MDNYITCNFAEILHRKARQVDCACSARIIKNRGAFGHKYDLIWDILAEIL